MLVIMLIGCKPPVAHPTSHTVPLRLLGCRVDSAPHVSGSLFHRGSEEPHHWPVTAEEGHLSCAMHPLWKGRTGPGQGVLSLEGYAPVEVTWEAGAGGLARCSPEVLTLAPADTFISGRVRPIDGDPVTVVGCGGYAVARADGTFRMAVTPGARCRLWAGSPSRWVLAGEVSPVEGGTRNVSVDCRRMG